MAERVERLTDRERFLVRLAGADTMLEHMSIQENHHPHFVAQWREHYREVWQKAYDAGYEFVGYQDEDGVWHDSFWLHDWGKG